MGEDDLGPLIALIRLLEATPPITKEQARSKNKLFMDQVSGAMLKEGVTFGQASGLMPHLNRPDAKEYIRSINDDLTAQVAITSQNVRSWFAFGEFPAPAYSWRICVILKKQKQIDLERKFLSAYSKHFHTTLGSTYGKLAKRAAELGAYPP